MKPIKTGVIGKGFIGPAHAEALRRLGNIEVTALAGTDAVETRQKADALGILEAYGDWRKLIAHPEIQAVHICSPNSLHYVMAREALKAGKHVICEKPLCSTLKEADELTELAEKSGLVHAVHFNIRYYPLMRQLKLMREKGELGEIFAVHGSYLQDWLYYATDYNWRLEPEISGESRAVADIGSHWIDLVEWVSGLRITEVMADFATFHKIRKKPLKPLETYAGKILSPEDYRDVAIHTEDYASVMFHFDSGAHGVMTVNQAAAGRKNRLSFEIDGSVKSSFWDSEIPNQLWLGRRDGNNEILMKDPSLVYPEARELIGYPGGHNEGFPDTSRQMFGEIYRAIGEGRMPESPRFPTFREGRREILLGERILASRKKAGWVPVGE